MFSVFRNHSETSFAWKGRSPGSRSRLSKSVISSAVLGFLILFNAVKISSLRRRLEFSTFFIGTERIFCGTAMTSGLGRILEKVKAVTLVML